MNGPAAAGDEPRAMSVCFAGADVGGWRLDIVSLMLGRGGSLIVSVQLELILNMCA